MKTSKRNSNFELLRIITMLLIVFHHSIVHGLLVNSTALGQGNPVTPQIWGTVFVGQMVAMFGKVAVAIFVMISGYFLVNSKSSGKRSLKKVLFLTAQVYFYSVIIYLVAAHFKWINPKDSGTLQQAFLPLFYNTNWFATEYLMLYLIYPYLNVALHNINQRQHRNLILILIVTFTVVPTIFPNFGNYGSYGLLVVFILYYVIGAYIRLYNLKNEKKIGGILAISSVLLLVIVIYCNDYLGKISNNQHYYINSLNIVQQYSFIIVLIAIGIILFFKHIDLGQNRVINTIAATTFGIYLIHDNPIMEQAIWMKWLNMPSLLTPNVGHLLSVIVVVCPLIFIVCSLIDYIRIKIFNGIAFVSSKLKNK